MSTSNNTPQGARAWWATSNTRSRLTALGASGILLALLATSAFVWNSPQNIVRQAIAGGEARSDADRLVEERNALLSQIVELQKTIDASTAAIAASDSRSAVIQQALWTAQGKLEAIDKARAAQQALNASGGSSTAIAGSEGPATTPEPRPVKAPLASPISAPSKAKIISPSSSYFGMYTEQAPFNFATYDSTAAKIGSQPNVVGYFGGWDQKFRPDAVERAWQRNLLPVLTWESRPIASGNDRIEEPDYRLPDIIGDKANGIAGSYDSYLRTYARSIVKTGLPLGIRLDHEMNGVWYPWSETDSSGKSINANRVGDYVKMWRHVHDIFEAEGANDLVVWIWSPNITNNLPASHKKAGFLANLYPGDDYVDWVGLSGYLRPAYKADNDFSFEYTFDASLNELRSISRRPIFLAEVGASETGGHKPAWISSFFTALAKPENSDIVGFSWFNLAVTSYTEGQRSTNDWRIDSRKDSLTAFADGLSTPGAGFHLRKTP